MAGVTGLEPAASGVTGQRSNRLSYTPRREVALVYEVVPLAVKRANRVLSRENRRRNTEGGAGVAQR